MKGSILHSVSTLICIGLTLGQIQCPDECDLTKCTPFDSTECTAGTVKDECDCCLKCAQAEDEICDLPENLDPRGTSGKCGDNLKCVRRTDISDEIKEGVCKCTMPGSVCGTDGVTYDNFCKLRRVTPEITVEHRGRCQSKPVILNELENIEVNVGDELVLRCEVAGNPQPLVWWQFRSNKEEPYALPGGDTGIFVSSRGGNVPYTIISWLQIQSAAESHEGDYSCITDNSRGDDSLTTRVKVIRPSEKPKQ